MTQRISTPVVLASASAMIAIGVVAFMMAGAPHAEQQDRRARAQLSELRIDDRTPESAAESFLDAWRRRAWDEAERVATGEALSRVHAKRAGEEEFDERDREMAREVWQTLAGAPLRVQFSGSEELAGGRLALSGLAGYQLVGQPYRREMAWVLAPVDGRWRVESMTPGRVITDLPRILDPEQ